MTEEQIRDLTFRGHELQLKMEKDVAELKDIKRQLVQEAASRPQEHQAIEASDGTVWFARAAGCEAQVTFPTDTLKETLKATSKDYAKLTALVTPSAWDHIFEPVEAIRPRSNFRALVNEHFPSAAAKKIIGLCTTASTPKVSWKDAA